MRPVVPKELVSDITSVRTFFPRPMSHIKELRTIELPARWHAVEAAFDSEGEEWCLLLGNFGFPRKVVMECSRFDKNDKRYMEIEGKPTS